MSDNWIQIIATDPTFVPPPSAQADAVAAMRSIAPNADEVQAVDEGHIVFVDAGTNFESVNCPNCKSRLNNGGEGQQGVDDWWSVQKDRAAQSAFENRDAVCPDCLAKLDLNDLSYDWPQGFARWRLEAMNPVLGTLSGGDTERLAALIGHDVRVVYTHL